MTNEDNEPQNDDHQRNVEVIILICITGPVGGGGREMFHSIANVYSCFLHFCNVMPPFLGYFSPLLIPRTGIFTDDVQQVMSIITVFKLLCEDKCLVKSIVH